MKNAGALGTKFSVKKLTVADGADGKEGPSPDLKPLTIGMDGKLSAKAGESSTVRSGVSTKSRVNIQEGGQPSTTAGIISLVNFE